MRAPSHGASRAQEASAIDLVCAPASMRTGALLDETIAKRAYERLEGLAATLPDLFGTLDPTCLDRIAERLGGEPGDTTFNEILLLSDKSLHVIQPLATQPGIALVAECPATSSIGLVLSAIRAHIVELEAG
ncbi:MAG TPA: hypothetical protein VJV79_00605 [Polyangiaceae bacterium]|nr:hypothetical protein [Polyangiaceae bacterium]